MSGALSPAVARRVDDRMRAALERRVQGTVYEGAVSFIKDQEQYSEEDAQSADEKAAAGGLLAGTGLDLDGTVGSPAVERATGLAPAQEGKGQDPERGSQEGGSTGAASQDRSVELVSDTRGMFVSTPASPREAAAAAGDAQAVSEGQTDTPPPKLSSTWAGPQAAEPSRGVDRSLPGGSKRPPVAPGSSSTRSQAGGLSRSGMSRRPFRAFSPSKALRAASRQRQRQAIAMRARSGGRGSASKGKESTGQRAPVPPVLPPSVDSAGRRAEQALSRSHRAGGLGSKQGAVPAGALDGAGAASATWHGRAKEAGGSNPVRASEGNQQGAAAGTNPSRGAAAGEQFPGMDEIRKALEFSTSGPSGAAGAPAADGEHAASDAHASTASAGPRGSTAAPASLGVGNPSSPAHVQPRTMGASKDEGRDASLLQQLKEQKQAQDEAQAQLRQELEQAKQAASKWEETAAQAKQQVQALEARAKDAESRIGDLESMKRTQRHSGAATGRQLAQLQSKLDTTQSQLQEEQGKSKRMQEEMEGLRQQAAAGTAGAGGPAVSETDAQAYAAELEQERARSESLRKDLEAAKDRSNRAEARAEEAQQAFEEVRTRLRNSEADAQGLREVLQRLEGEMGELREHISSGAAGLDQGRERALAQEVERLQQRCTDATKAHEEAARQIDALSAQVSEGRAGASSSGSFCGMMGVFLSLVAFLFVALLLAATTG